MTAPMPTSFQPSVCEEGRAVGRGQPVDDVADEAEQHDLARGDQRRA